MYKQVPDYLRKAIIKRDSRTCQYCGDNTSKIYFCDHIIPCAQGGPTEPQNLTTACPSCNVLKRGQVWEPKNLDKISIGGWAEKVRQMSIPYEVLLVERLTERVSGCITKKQAAFLDSLGFNSHISAVRHLINLAMDGDSWEHYVT